MTEKYLIVGAGGHARVLIEALRSGGARIEGLIDANPALTGKNIDGIRVLGGDDAVSRFAKDEILLVNGVGGVNSTAVRRKIYERFVSQGWRFAAVAAASAQKAQSATQAPGSQLITAAVLHPGATLGENSVVNTAAVVEHDCVVAAHVFISPGAVLCGGVKVEEDAFIGAGAVILPGLRVGAGALVAAGAVVSKDVPAQGHVAGGRSLTGGKK